MGEIKTSYYKCWANTRNHVVSLLNTKKLNKVTDLLFLHLVKYQLKLRQEIDKNENLHHNDNCNTENIRIYGYQRSSIKPHFRIMFPLE